MLSWGAVRPYLLLGLLALAHPVAAETITHTLGHGKTVFADYREGGAERPAILILHGFLQTHEFGLIQSLASELAENGYTVLAPTLSLDIEQRKKSLACSAIHTHTLEDSVTELGDWIAWLNQRGHQDITLISHSSTGIALAYYASEQPHASVKRLILLSLGTFFRGDDQEDPQSSMLDVRAQLRQNETTLHTYTLGFCEGNYTAPPRAMLSYLRWDQPTILATLHKAKLPTTLILGGADNYLPSRWRQTLQGSGLNVQIITAADHFFSGPHEFELFDAIHTRLGAP